MSLLYAISELELPFSDKFDLSVPYSHGNKNAEGLYELCKQQPKEDS